MIASRRITIFENLYIFVYTCRKVPLERISKTKDRNNRIKEISYTL